jgi:hypothetical protein
MRPGWTSWLAAHFQVRRTSMAGVIDTIGKFAGAARERIASWL